MGNPFRDIKDAVQDFGESVVDGIQDVGEGILDLAGDAISNVLGTVLDVDAPEAPEPEKGILLNLDSATKKIPVIYGERRTGGIRVVPGWVSGTNNEYLHIVLVLCEGEIESINDVYINDQNTISPKFNGLVDMTKYTGTVTQAADPTMMAAFPSLWTSAHQLKGLAYLACRFKWDENRKAYSGFPRITCDVKGKKVYDPRTTTTVYSTNPALVIRDYLTNTIYGRGLTAANDVDDAAIISAADTCEVQQTISTTDASTEDTFAINGSVNTERKVLDNIKLLLTTCRGILPYVQGKYELVIRDQGVGVFDFNKTNIIGGWSFKGTSKTDRLNLVKVRFANPAKDYQADVAIKDSVTFLNDDNGLVLEKEISNLYETSYSRALHRAETILKESRENITVGFVSTIEALKVKAGSICTVTHDTPGWTAKKFRVANLDLTQFGNVAVALVEHEDAVYDRTVSAEQTPPDNTELPNPFDVSDPTGLAIDGSESQILIAQDKTLITRALISWNSPNDIFVVRTEVEFKKSSDSDYRPGNSAHARTGNSVYIQNLEDNTNYDFRIRHVNGQGAISDWVIASELIEGKSAPPGDVNSITVQRQADGTREYSWVYSSPPVDLRGFHFRYKSGTGGTWATATDVPGGELIDGGLRLFESNQLSAGAYTFLVKAVDTTGNESTNAVSTEVTLGPQRLGTAILTEDAKALGWPGTLTQARKETNGNIYAESQSTWATLPSTWDAWTSWIDNPYLSGVRYEHTQIDLGAIVNFVINDSNTTNATTITREARWSDDAIAWSAWTTITGTIRNGRYVEYRITLAIGSGLIELSALNITINQG